MGLLPTAVTISLAVPLAERYILLRKRFDKSLESSYEVDTTFQHKAPRLRVVARSTVISILGILSIVVSIAGVSPGLLQSPIGLLTIILSSLLALTIAPSLHITSWLLIRSGVMYENKVNGTRINMGRDLKKLLEIAIGPFAALNFIKVIFTEYPNIGTGVALIAAILFLAVPSVFVTILLLRRKALTRLSIELNERLKKSLV